MVCKGLTMLVLSVSLSLSGAEFIGDASFLAEISTPEEMALRARHDSVRFDLLGSVRQIRFDGKEFLTQEGLCDEFGILIYPPGYAEAAPRGPFMKYGIGVLLRDTPPGTKYEFYHPYPIANLFVTTMKKQECRIVFEQQSPDFQGFSYYYRKTIDVAVDKHSLTISYELRNTGTSSIVTDQYNHNFFCLPGNIDGYDYRVRTAFTAKPIRLTGNSFDYNDRVFTHFRPTDKGCYTASTEPIQPDQNEFEITHPDSPYRVTIRGDFPSARFAVSFLPKASISPEVFIPINLPPGQTQTWTRTYTFSSTPPTKTVK